MRASFNELRSLFKQVYQGAGLAPGLYDAAADNIVWTEAIGLGGFELFEKQLSRNQAFNECQLTQRELAENAFSVDLGGACLAYGSHLVTGLLKAHAIQHEQCACWIKSSSSAVFLLRELCKLAQSGLSVMLVWNEHKDQIIASSCATGLGVEVDRFEQHSTIEEEAFGLASDGFDSDTQALMLAATSRSTLLSLASANGVTPQRPAVAHISTMELESVYLGSLQNGIEISTELWQRLSSLAAHSLVEASEQSRRGAGA